MAVEIITSFGRQIDSNGVPLSGALVYVYDVGTTTLKTVYSDNGLGSSAANPIVCDAYGLHDMRYIATGSYKIVVKTSAGTTVYTRDNIDGRVPIGSGTLAIADGGTGSATAEAALAALGAATAAELADVTAEVATISGALGSTEQTSIATGTTAQRPASPAFGQIRANSTTTEYEAYISGSYDNFMLESDNAASTAVVAAETAGATYIRPDRLKYSKRTALAWGRITTSGGTPTLADSFNVASISDQGIGYYEITFATAPANATYAVVATVSDDTPRVVVTDTSTPQTTALFRIRVFTLAPAAYDPPAVTFTVFGDFS